MGLSQVTCGGFYSAKTCQLNKSFVYTQWMENMKFDKFDKGKGWSVNLK